MATAETLRSAGDNSTLAFDVERVRADFPILQETVHGKPLVYLDSGASAQKPEAVLQAMDEVYRTGYAN
jgi:cysteine desulfurase/selenocysteine lyase